MKVCKICQETEGKFLGRLCAKCNARRALQWYKDTHAREKCFCCGKVKVINTSTGLCRNCRIIHEYKGLENG